MATQNERAQSTVKLANHNAQYNYIIYFLELGHILTVNYIYILYNIYIYIYISENLKK